MATETIGRLSEKIQRLLAHLQLTRESAVLLGGQWSQERERPGCTFQHHWHWDTCTLWDLCSSEAAQKSWQSQIPRSKWWRLRWGRGREEWPHRMICRWWQACSILPQLWQRSGWHWSDSGWPLCPVNGKYQDRTAAILVGLGSELKADVESEPELGQWEAKPKPTAEEFCTKSNRAKRHRWLRRGGHRRLGQRRPIEAIDVSRGD